MNREARYKTLVELKAAYDKGEIPREWEMTLDNDSSTVYDPDSDYGELGLIYDGGPPGCILEEALTLLGIPWRSA